MPFVEVKLLEGRPPDKIEELIANLTQTVSETLGSPKENIRVIIQEIPKSHWGIAGDSARQLGR